jgi:hypothetical protein
MPRYYLDPTEGVRTEISAAMFGYLISGASIKNIEVSKRTMRSSLSGSIALSVYQEGNDQHLIVSKTGNNDDPSATIPLSSEHSDNKLIDIGERLLHLRQLYALLVLIESDRAGLAADALSDNFAADLELMLDEEDRLIIEAAGQGTFWSVVKTAGATAAKAPKAVVLMLSAMFADGRAIILRYGAAMTRREEAQGGLLEAQAERERAGAERERAEARYRDVQAADLASEVERKNADAQLENAKKIIEIFEKIDAISGGPDADVLKRRLAESIAGINPETLRLTHVK